jgi:uncharacterized repeat protein (TIGR03803 family)
MALWALLATSPVSAAATGAPWTGTILAAFSGKNGAWPYTALTPDAAGNLYTVTLYGGAYDNGTIVKLSPPAPGGQRWSETVLHAFTGNGGSGATGLVFDAAGNLYGTSSGGEYKQGTVFELSPPTAGSTRWTYTTLHNFTGKDAASPQAGLIFDKAGNLYSAACAGGEYNNGAVFELSPPTPGTSVWKEKTLVSFAGTNGSCATAGVIFDKSGNLYGTTAFGGTNGDGTVYELSPPAPGATSWTLKVLLNFDGANGETAYNGLTADTAGNLYGVTYYGGAYGTGVVFELTPPASGTTSWQETIIASMSGRTGAYPQSNLTFDKAGNIYGTTWGGGAAGGTAYEFSPPAAGKTAWTETVLHSLSGNTGAPLLFDAQGNLYSATATGGKANDGYVFELFPRK